MPRYTRKRIEDTIQLTGMIHLCEQDLQGLDLSGLVLSNAKLSQAILTEANLSWAKLEGADEYFVKPPDLNQLIDSIERAVTAAKKQ